MTIKNRYYKRSRITERKFRLLVRYFSQDLLADDIADLVGISRNSVNLILKKIRMAIHNFCEKESPFSGEVELDESYFGPRRVRGKKGRGAYGKTIVFGILKRAGKVYTEIVPDCKKASLQAIIRGKVDSKSVIHTDGWRDYNGLVDVGYKKHFRVKHSEDEFVNSVSHINGIESFWSFAKRRLSRFNGISKTTFYLHLKESEFRFNYRGVNLYSLLLKIFRKNPL